MAQSENVEKREPLKNTLLEQEIADRKSAEEALNGLQQIINRSPVVVFRWRNENNWPVDFVSQNVASIFGYSPDDFLKQTITYIEIIHPEDLERVTKEVRTPKNIVGIDTVIHKPYRIITKSGEIKWIEDKTYILRDADGHIIQYEGIVFDITSRKHTEEALEESELKFRLLANNRYDWEYWLNPDGTYFYMSSSCERITGYSQDEFKAIPNLLLSLVKPEYVDLVKNHFEHDQKRTPESSSLEFPILAKDGEEKWIEHSCSLVFDEQGQYAGRRGYHRDITDRKRIEKHLVMSEEKFYKAFYGHPTAMQIVDIETGERIDFNDSYCQITGYTKEELHHTNAFSLNFHADQEVQKAGLNKLISDGFAKDYPVDMVHKSGEIRNWLATVSLFDYSEGRRLAIASYVDVTERKRSEEHLAILSAAIQHSPVSIMITDASGNIEYVNPKFFELTKYSPEEVIGKTPRFLSSGELSKETYRDLWNTILSGKEWRGEFHNRKKTGELYWEDVAISSIQNKQGEITHFLAVKEDITARKEALEEKSALEKQLRHAQKLETVGTLASGIAHDFNNILAPILGYTDMAMLEQKKNTKLYEDLGHVLTAAHRAKDLVAQILLFSKQGERERNPLMLPPLMKEALKLLCPSIPSTIEIIRKIDSTCPPILADATQIHQVIVNLCTNAWQVMEENGGTLTIELNQETISETTAKQYPRLHQIKYARLSVMDTGPGMSEQVLDRIFEPFYTTKEVDKGTGLGLSVVHGIVHHHKGEIIVKSEPGKGSTFHIYLPFAKSKPIESKLPSHKILRGSELLMIVDDERTIAEMLDLMLTKFGYEVNTFASGVDALEAFKKRPDDYALIISDLTMPKMTGLKLADHVHLIRPDFPVVLMTGFSNRIPLETQNRHHIKEIIDKPISVQGLTSMIRNVLDRD